MSNQNNGTAPVIMDINLDEVYIDQELNNREVGDTDEELESFASSIEAAGGLLQPIIVYKSPADRLAEHGKPYELNSGYRRSAALRWLAETRGNDSWIKSVPARVGEEAPAAQRHIEQLIENLQRKDLNPMEIGLAFCKAIDDNQSDLTQASLAKQIGWSAPTVSTYIKAARNLDAKVQDLVIAGKLSWSNAREISAKALPPEQQVKLAEIGCNMTPAAFTDYLNETYGTADANKDEAAATTEAATTETQRAHSSIRSTELKDKYLPKLEEMAKGEKNKVEKAKLDARIDTIKFVLKTQGTELGTTLAPWEQELQAKHEAEKANEEADRLRTKYIRQCVQTIKKLMTTIPTLDINSTEHALNFPESLERIKATVEADLKKAKDGGAEDGVMPQGFKVVNTDEFIKEVADTFVENKRKDEERNAARKKKQEEEAAAKKAEEEKKAGRVAATPELEAATA